jgi:hypothetical protein
VCAPCGRTFTRIEALELHQSTEVHRLIASTAFEAEPFEVLLARARAETRARARARAARAPCVRRARGEARGRAAGAPRREVIHLDYLLAVDPGKHACGAALFREGLLLACAWVRRDEYLHAWKTPPSSRRCARRRTPCFAGSRSSPWRA